MKKKNTDPFPLPWSVKLEDSIGYGLGRWVIRDANTHIVTTLSDMEPLAAAEIVRLVNKGDQSAVS